MLRRAPKRLRTVCSVEYDLEKAKKAHAEIAAIDTKKLCTAGEVTMLPYPGIGKPPSRPGGDISFVGRPDLLFLLEAASNPSALVLLVQGPFGIGKSCFLRALACSWIKDSLETSIRVVCIWDMESALNENDLVSCVKNALRFTYCNHTDQQEDITALNSMEGIHGFLRSRRAAGEKFLYIIDQAELFDVITSVGEEGALKERRAKYRKQVEEYLVCTAVVVVYGVSPMSGITNDRTTRDIVILEDGFAKEELVAFKNKLSVLGLLCSRFPERTKLVEYYTGRHPFSLAVMDRSCRQYASSKLTPKRDLHDYGLPLKVELKEPSLDEVTALLIDHEDWEAAIETFLSCGEMQSIRSLLKHVLEVKKPQRAYYTIEDMASLDTRFIVGDELDCYEFVTEYISQIYTEEFRAAEKSRVYHGGAWEPYCKYLLQQQSLNWAQMGWICQNLVGDVIQSKGIKLDGMEIENVRLQRFSKVPSVSSWSYLVNSPCSGVFFLPLKYNYGSIDGVIIWRDADGNLHLFALQVTVNEHRHQHSADDFMKTGVISQWLPEILTQEDSWTLHFVFLCCRDAAKVEVPSRLSRLRDDVVFGELGYMKHTVSIQSAFQDLIDAGGLSTLEEVARKRDDAEPEHAVQPTPTPMPTTTLKSSTDMAALVRRVLDCMRKDQLESVLKKSNVQLPTKSRKLELVDALVALFADGGGRTD